jgi:hypothetical protein
MLAASLLEIFLVPVLFVLVERVAHRFSKEKLPVWKDPISEPVLPGGAQ